MATVSLDLPADLVSVASSIKAMSPKKRPSLSHWNCSAKTRFQMGRAAELCKTPLETFMQFAGEHEVPWHYGIAQLEEDRRTLERLGL